jgi:hypothetical protein
VHFYSGKDVPLFLLAVIQKGERSDLTQAQKNALRKELAGLVADYRASTAKKARERRARLA